MTRALATGGPGGIVGAMFVGSGSLDHMVLGPFVDGQFLSHVWFQITGVGAVGIVVGMSMVSSDDRSDEAYVAGQGLVSRSEASILGKPALNFAVTTNPNFSFPVALGFGVSASRRFFLVSMAVSAGTSATLLASVFPFLMPNVATPVRVVAPDVV